MTTTLPPPSGAETGRLLRRAQLVARLRHPNLVRMLALPGGAGLAPVLKDARRLADFTLPAGTFKRFDLEQIVRLLLDVLSGLAALHEVEHEGVPFVHGEASPRNVYVDEHGTARLVPLTSSHLLLGSKPDYCGYVAPERLLGDAVDGRADVFSVGVMLWEALSGERLFPDPTPDGVVARLTCGVPPIVLGPRVAWAKPLVRIAERAIAADPQARFESALELSNAIAAAAAQQLSQVDTDAWQEEAPTPVFRPGHLAQLRSTTPAPQIIDLAPPAGSPRSGPPPLPSAKPAPTAAAKEPTAPAPSQLEPLAVWQRGRRGRGAVLGLLALLLVAAFATAPRAPGVLQRAERNVGAAATWLEGSQVTRAELTKSSALPTLTLGSAVPPPSAGALASTGASGQAPASRGAPPAAKANSDRPASSAPSGSAAALKPQGLRAAGRSAGAEAVPLPVTKPASKPKSSRGDADYGI